MQPDCSSTLSVEVQCGDTTDSAMILGSQDIPTKMLVTNADKKGCYQNFSKWPSINVAGLEGGCRHCLQG